MSRPAPTPKQNFIQTMLLVTTMFLAFTLFCKGPQSGAPDTRSPQDVLKSMREMDSKLLDLSIIHENGALGGKINEALNATDKTKKISEQDADKLRFEGAVLVADTQLKAGLQRNETTRIRLAYQALDNLNRKNAANTDWTNQQISLPAPLVAPERFPWAQVTGPQLYDKVVEQLKARNQTDLVWGFMPGGYQFIDFLVHLTGAIPSFSYWFAALLLAVCVRGAVYPLTQKQLMWSRQMAQLTPRIKEIREQYKDDQQQQQAKMMELYKEYGINPMAGCGPALVQMPLFLFVYQCMLHYQFSFQNGTFLWINDATSKATHGFVAPNLGHVDTILIVLYGISLVCSTLLQPVTDPTQVKQQRLMGLSFAILMPIFMLLGFMTIPAAFVLYWTFTNIFATAQSLRAYRMPLPPLVKVNTKTGGTFPGGGFFGGGGDATPKGPTNGSSGGSSNGSLNGKTGTPVKHKPKKRK